MGPARMHPPEPCHPPRKPAQPAHLSLFIRNVRPKHDSHISKTAVPFCWHLLGPFPLWWLQADALFAPQLEPRRSFGPEVTVTSWTSCMVAPVPTAQGPGPGVWSWASVLGQARTVSALLEFGWSLGNLAGAQAFVTGLSMLLPKLERMAGFPEGQPAASAGKLLTKGHEQRGGCSEMLYSAHGGLCKMVLQLKLRPRPPET